jgi:hypothetical protein
MRKIAVIVALAFVAFPAAAGAAPMLNLDIHHAQTNFPPGGALATPSVSVQTQGSTSANEVQQVVIPASKGKFKLSFEGQVTPELPYNATAGAVQAALRALPTIGSPNVEVSPSVEDPSVSPYRSYKVLFNADLARTNVPVLEVASAPAPDDLRRGPELWFDLDNVGADCPPGSPATRCASTASPNPTPPNGAAPALPAPR